MIKMMINHKLSPMTVYKIRKILIGHNQHDESLISSFQIDSEAQLDLDSLLSDLYSSKELTLKVQELEALASCYQNLATAGASYQSDLTSIEHQILAIFNISSSPSTPAATPNLVSNYTNLSLEMPWLSRASCPTVADVLLRLNTILKISSHYIGPRIAQRLMAEAQPQTTWVSEFTLGADAQFNFRGNIQDAVSESQWVLIQDWVALYVKSCATVLSNFPLLLARDFAQP